MGLGVTFDSESGKQSEGAVLQWEMELGRGSVKRNVEAFMMNNSDDSKRKYTRVWFQADVPNL